jgi:hypothetical protein
VEQLELLPANQVLTLREYSLSFPDLTAANPVGVSVPASAQQVNDAAKKLKGIFRRKQEVVGEEAGRWEPATRPRIATALVRPEL